MNKTNTLIAHGIIKVNGKYLVTKRTKIKRGEPNVFPEFWDIPGGHVEPGELPADAVVRETLEEVNLNVVVKQLVHEDSTDEVAKDKIYTRLVYWCELVSTDELDHIKLDLEEHSEFKFIASLTELGSEKMVPYLEFIFSKDFAI